MCIIVYKKKNANLPAKDVLQTCFERNPHGAGFAYVDKKHKQVIIKKNYLNFENFYNDLMKYKNDEQMLLHFRIATGSKHNWENCHPFRLQKDLVLAHNGILPCFQSSSRLSDTNKLVRLLRGFNANLSTINNNRWLLEELIGCGNKIVVMGINKALILNERAGTWEKDCWFSNNSYKSFNVLQQNIFNLF